VGESILLLHDVRFVRSTILWKYRRHVVITTNSRVNRKPFCGVQGRKAVIKLEGDFDGLDL
jgi:hypothetical protein